MTLYETLSIIAPILTLVLSGIIIYFVKNIDKRFSSLEGRMNKFNERMTNVEKEVYFIKGFLEGGHTNKNH